MTTTAPKLTPEQLKAFGDELDAIRRRVIADLGDDDRAYIHDIVRKQRKFEVAGRALMYVPVLGWLPAVTCLSISKILDNMEIGHNVMHGQYDWMGDPALNSRMFDWDTACPGEQWKYSHNYIHHTYTNVLDMDRDIGYGILRMDDAQKWHPRFLANPVNAFLLMVLFQYGVALHDLEVDRIIAGEKTWAETKHLHRGLLRKLRRQTVKDYVLFPILTGPLFPLTFLGNGVANLVRNIWAFNIIFCGHFPAGVESFTIEECQDEEGPDGWNESRGHWYYRQILGSANITGGKLFHVMSGNLSHQIEHHLFPDIPARRYPEISAEIQEICQRYGLPYNTGRLSKQLWTVASKIVRLSLPSKKPSVTAEPVVVESTLAA
ncbi:MAG: fatty acid desaturase family protein [Marmoricola sp.]